MCIRDSYEPRVRAWVMVLEQLEEEPEAAAMAGDRLLGQPFVPVVVDRAVLAVRTDEVRHRAMVAPRLGAAAPSPGECARVKRSQRRQCQRRAPDPAEPPIDRELERGRDEDQAPAPP